ncbi:MAG: VOC family protein [Actinomycetota bacterium]
MPRRPLRYGGREDTELTVVLDCADIDRSAAFWCAALGYVSQPFSGTYCSLAPADGDGIELLLQRVSDPKRTKNRMHFDLRVRDLEPEVTRLLGLGARQLTAEPLEEDGWMWHVLCDPDGNEFCVLRPPPSHGDG